MAKRECGNCNLCCRLLPVADNLVGLHKPAGSRCKYQRHGRGCSVYGGERMPTCCKLWTCRWLADPDAAELRRPDNVHYVVDGQLDAILVTEEGKEPVPVAAIQVWVDPNYPDAFSETSLLDYLYRKGRDERMVAIIRYSSNDGFVLFPPTMTGGAGWVKHEAPAIPITTAERLRRLRLLGRGEVEIDDRHQIGRFLNELHDSKE